jgi:hypothetical protein
MTTFNIITFNAYAKCHYAECRYAECHYAECRGNVHRELFPPQSLSRCQWRDLNPQS